MSRADFCARLARLEAKLDPPRGGRAYGGSDLITTIESRQASSVLKNKSRLCLRALTLGGRPGASHEDHTIEGPRHLGYLIALLPSSLWRSCPVTHCPPRFTRRAVGSSAGEEEYSFSKMVEHVERQREFFTPFSDVGPAAVGLEACEGPPSDPLARREESGSQMRIRFDAFRRSRAWFTRGPSPMFTDSRAPDIRRARSQSTSPPRPLFWPPRVGEHFLPVLVACCEVWSAANLLPTTPLPGKRNSLLFPPISAPHCELPFGRFVYPALLFFEKAVGRFYSFSRLFAKIWRGAGAVSDNERSMKNELEPQPQPREPRRVIPAVSDGKRGSYL